MSDSIVSRPSNDAYREGWIRIWGRQDEPETLEKDEKEDANE